MLKNALLRWLPSFEAWRRGFRAPLRLPLKSRPWKAMRCGRQSFIFDLARKFRTLGVPRDRIITEEFEFR